MIKSIADIGLMYGNLRTENVLLKFNKQMNNIQKVKFINFGTVVAIEDPVRMCLPD